MLRKILFFNPTLETRVKCDASRHGLGAALEQLDSEGWKKVAFASRFLDSNEERYSIIELELLGVVWAIEYFKYYLFGKNFTVLTDHRALLLVLKSHRSNKSYNSRLTRWIDRLLHFDFNIEHIPGNRMEISWLHFAPTKSESRKHHSIWWGIHGSYNFPHSRRNYNFILSLK